MKTKTRLFQTLLHLVLLYLSGMGFSLSASTFHVGTGGSDTAEGSESKPWRSIQHAVDSAVAGDRIVVGQGVYAEDVNWDAAGAGTAEAPIELNGGDVATVHRLSISKPYWKITRFRVSGYDVQFRAHVQLENHAHFTVFENNVVDNAGAIYQPGIAFSQSGGGPFNADWPSNCIVRNNTITGVKARAALLMCGSNNLFEGNTVRDLISADMIRLFGENNIIRGNHFCNNVGEEGIGYHPDFVQTFGTTGIGSRAHIIERNMVVDCPTQIGQLVEGTERAPELIGTGAIGNWTFRNNIFANFKLGTSLTIPGTKWYNNVFYKVNYSSGHAIGSGLGDRGSSEGIRIYNNVFLDCGLLDRDNSGWYTINPDLEDHLFDHNYVSKNDYQPVREENPPSGFRWHEANGINGGDPKFVDFEAYDFRLRSDSPLRGKGRRIESFNDDFAGKTRSTNQGWDIGAFQYAEQTEGTPPAAPAGLRREE